MFHIYMHRGLSQQFSQIFASEAFSGYVVHKVESKTNVGWFAMSNILGNVIHDYKMIEPVRSLLYLFVLEQ